MEAVFHKCPPLLEIITGELESPGYSLIFTSFCFWSNFFSLLLSVSFFLPWSLWKGFYFFIRAQTANPLDHCCQFKVIQITNRLTVCAQGSQTESPTGTNWQGRQFDPSCNVFTFICRTMTIRCYKGIMKFSPTVTIVILTGINKCFNNA